MATRKQFAKRVLQKLTILENEEAVNSNDELLVLQAYDSAYAFLDKKKLVTWAANEDIPIHAELIMINYVANEIKEVFTIPPAAQQAIIVAASTAIDDLSAMVYNDYVHDTIPTVYY